MKDSNYWKSFSIRNIDDYNTYAEHLKDDRNYTGIKIAIIACFILLVIVACWMVS